MNDLLQVGLGNALVAAILAVPAFCLSRWGKRPAVAHVFWLFILIKLVTPPLWRVPVSLENLFATSENFAQQINSSVSSPGTGAPPEPERDAFRSEVLFVPAVPRHESLASRVPSPLPDADTGQVFTANSPALTPAPWREILVLGWLTGSLAILCLTLARLSSFVRCLKRVRPVQGKLQELAADLSVRLGLRTTPRLGVAPMRMAPLVWGWGSKARVVIPSELWDALDSEQRAMLLVHELAHLKRGDHWVRLLEIVVRTAYWWHPAVWLAAREMREAEEQCCDAWAVWVLPHAAKSYAQALVETVDFLSRGSVPLPVGASGIGQVQDLRRRLIMIMRGTTPRKLSAPVLVSLLMLGGTIVLLGPSFGQQRSSDEPASRDDPVRATASRADASLREVRFIDPVADDELDRLRQQEENLRRAMEALARTLEQTKRQLDSIEGVPARVPPAPQAQPRRAALAQPSPDAQPRSRVAPARASDSLPRKRAGGDVPVEERLSRLEERMSQIAEDLQALRHNMPPGTPPPARAIRTPSAPDMAPPAMRPGMPRQRSQPAPDGVLAVPSVDAVPPLPPATPRRIVPPAEVPSADPLETPGRRTRSADLEAPPLAPAQPRRATPPAVPVAPIRPAAPPPASRSVDEKPESVSATRP